MPIEQFRGHGPLSNLRVRRQTGLKKEAVGFHFWRVYLGGRGTCCILCGDAVAFGLILGWSGCIDGGMELWEEHGENVQRDSRCQDRRVGANAKGSMHETRLIMG